MNWIEILNKKGKFKFWQWEQKIDVKEKLLPWMKLQLCCVQCFLNFSKTSNTTQSDKTPQGASRQGIQDWTMELNNCLLLKIQITQFTQTEEKTKEQNLPLRTKERWVSRNLGCAKEEEAMGSWIKERTRESHKAAMEKWN